MGRGRDVFIIAPLTRLKQPSGCLKIQSCFELVFYYELFPLSF